MPAIIWMKALRFQTLDPIKTTEFTLQQLLFLGMDGINKGIRRHTTNH